MYCLWLHPGNCNDGSSSDAGQATVRQWKGGEVIVGADAQIDVPGRTAGVFAENVQQNQAALRALARY